MKLVAPRKRRRKKTAPVPTEPAAGDGVRAMTPVRALGLSGLLAGLLVALGGVLHVPEFIGAVLLRAREGVTNMHALKRTREEHQRDADAYRKALRRCKRVGKNDSRRGLLEAVRIPPSLIARGIVASAALDGDPIMRDDIVRLASHYNDVAVELLRLTDPGRA